MSRKEWVGFLQKNWKDIFCLAYSGISLSIPEFENDRIAKNLISLIIFSIFFRKSEKIYHEIKVFHVSSSYRDYINLFELFALLVSISHIFVHFCLFRLLLSLQSPKLIPKTTGSSKSMVCRLLIGEPNTFTPSTSLVQHC